MRKTKKISSRFLLKTKMYFKKAKKKKAIIIIPT